MLRKICCTIAIVLLSLIPTRPATAAGAEKPAVLTLKDQQGTKTKLSDLHGKIVVLNFWATWCGPCDAEMPMLVKTANSYAGKNVVFIGVSEDSAETMSKIAPYVTKLQIAYPIWVGATDEDMKRLHMGIAVPCTAFLDEDGIIRARILGQMRPGEVEERVDWLLRKQQGTAPAPLVTHLDKQ